MNDVPTLKQGSSLDQCKKYCNYNESQILL